MTSVAALWRYPVKSMLGELLDTAEIGERGLVGDRGYAVIDVETGKVAKAKHPGTWDRLLLLRARYAQDPSGVGPLPPVVITFPDGTELSSDDIDAFDAIDAALTRLLERPVRLAVQQQPAKPEQSPQWDITAHKAPPPGTFFDLATLHVITSATLAAVGADARRFRPNVILDGKADGFAEDGWPGRTLVLGADARARVDMPTIRCVMTTLGQADLPPDPSALQLLSQLNRMDVPGFGAGACAGAYATVIAPGRVGIGDTVQLH